MKRPQYGDLSDWHYSSSRESAAARWLRLAPAWCQTSVASVVSAVAGPATTTAVQQTRGGRAISLHQAASRQQRSHRGTMYLQYDIPDAAPLLKHCTLSKRMERRYWWRHSSKTGTRLEQRCRTCRFYEPGGFFTTRPSRTSRPLSRSCQSPSGS